MNPQDDPKSSSTAAIGIVSGLLLLLVIGPFLTGFIGIKALPTLEDYVQFVTTILLWVGVVFEMPMIMLVLARARIVNAGMLVRQWRIAVVVITIIAAVITPTPDPVNMGIVILPMLALYALSIILALFARR